MLTTPGLSITRIQLSSGTDIRVALPTTGTVHRETGLTFVGLTAYPVRLHDAPSQRL
jgi:hypothetical protein